MTVLNQNYLEHLLLHFFSNVQQIKTSYFILTWTIYIFVRKLLFLFHFIEAKTIIAQILLLSQSVF